MVVPTVTPSSLTATLVPSAALDTPLMLSLPSLALSWVMKSIALVPVSASMPLIAKVSLAKEELRSWLVLLVLPAGSSLTATTLPAGCGRVSGVTLHLPLASAVVVLVVPSGSCTVTLSPGPAVPVTALGLFLFSGSMVTGWMVVSTVKLTLVGALVMAPGRANVVAAV